MINYEFPVIQETGTRLLQGGAWERRLVKIKELAEFTGFKSVKAMLLYEVRRLRVGGICMKETCNYTTLVYPECSTGYCHICAKGTVVSCIVLAGLD